jgi:uncharacterized protein YyaL (SSP411 family)
MAQGGLYDHLGGGFARYSTDRKWLIPRKHSLYCQVPLFLESASPPIVPFCPIDFEKMLYDNALLAQAYLEAYKVVLNSLVLGDGSVRSSSHLTGDQRSNVR